MRILVIFTGGTIGSCVTKEYISLDDTAKYKLLNYFDYSAADVSFEAVSPYSVLSENLSADELNLLCDTIADKINNGYDGIIVTHGTDTLQYSATAAEYAFCNCKIPIVFVSAAYPLENPATNGYDNFEAAVEFISSGAANGVFVSYRNLGEFCVNIHIPSRIFLYNECRADLHCIDGVPFARFADGKLEVCNVPLADIINPIGNVHYLKNPGILCVDSYPGNSYSYSLDGINAVILKTYHSATLDTSNDGLVALCHRAADRRIPVFVVNVSGRVSYESTKLYDMLNIISLPYSTFVSAYVKIWAAISKGEKTDTFAKKPIAHEFVCAE